MHSIKRDVLRRKNFTNDSNLKVSIFPKKSTNVFSRESMLLLGGNILHVVRGMDRSFQVFDYFFIFRD